MNPRKVIYLALLAPCVLATGSAAQEAGSTYRAKADTIPEFNRIRTPDSPAFVLLGVSPAEIQRPTQPRDLAITLGTLLTKQDELTVPKNIAVEVAPYWLVSHHKLTLDDYKSNDGRWYRDFSFSVGSTTSESTTGAATEPLTRLAVGMRTRILAGRTTASADAAEARILAQTDLLAAEAAGEAGQYVEKIAPELTKKHTTNGNFDEVAFNEEVADLTNKKQTEVFEERLVEAEQSAAEEAKALAAREGFISDFAIATSWGFRRAAFEEGRWESSRAWFTFGWEEGSGKTALLAVRYGGEAGKPWSWDSGLRGILARDRYAISAEGMYRTLVDEKDDEDLYRVALAFDYMVRDGSWLTVSFGKDFEGKDVGSLFTLANLKWGIGEPQVKVPVRTP